VATSKRSGRGYKQLPAWNNPVADAIQNQHPLSWQRFNTPAVPA
jgi:hypothetical protein